MSADVFIFNIEIYVSSSWNVFVIFRHLLRSMRSFCPQNIWNYWYFRMTELAIMFYSNRLFDSLWKTWNEIILESLSTCPLRQKGEKRSGGGEIDEGHNPDCTLHNQSGTVWALTQLAVLSSVWCHGKTKNNSSQVCCLLPSCRPRWGDRGGHTFGTVWVRTHAHSWLSYLHCDVTGKQSLTSELPI